MKNPLLEVPVSPYNEAIAKDDAKCIVCGYCKRVCAEDITVAKLFEYREGKEPICINCGQCANLCPTEAIHEKWDYQAVSAILADKRGRKVAISIAPAVRVALGEDLGFEVGANLESRIATALRALGADYVFDITFGADITVMEEAAELVERLGNGGKLPMFTSCCPAWVKYCEIFHPDLIPNLSTAKSPIAMQSSIIKTYFAGKEGLKAEDIINVVVAPCTAKKSEVARADINFTERDTDYLLTTRELAIMLKDPGIDVKGLLPTAFDSPLGKGSGAGVIFGSSGGVTEAALRTAYYYITGANLSENALDFLEVRGMQGIKETAVEIAGRKIKVAVCNGMKYAAELIGAIKRGEAQYDFIEVMNCLGGCVAGGGQPKITLLEMDNTKRARMDAIYKEDSEMTLRLCHENPEIKAIYADLFIKPNGEVAEAMLHRTYEDKSYLLKGGKTK